MADKELVFVMCTPLMGGSDSEPVSKICEHDLGCEGGKTFGGGKLDRKISVFSDNFP